jgi:hypothetical protein
MKEKLTEEVIVDRIIEFMLNKVDGNWHEEKVEKSDLHKHGVDIKLVGGKRNSEYFYINAKASLMPTIKKIQYLCLIKLNCMSILMIHY